MKKTNSREMKISFKNATITKEDGIYKIVEITKDGDEENNLSKELDALLEIDGLNITINRKDEE